MTSSDHERAGGRFHDVTELAGAHVVVGGAGGVTPAALVRTLTDLSARITVVDDQMATLDAIERACDGISTVLIDDAVRNYNFFTDVDLLVTSPGFRPTSSLMVSAASAGVPVWGDVELAWWADRSERFGPRHQWLVITGTNGKTTTTSMTEAIVRISGRRAVSCGNIGLPVVDALRLGARILVVELSSFQLHWAPSVRPTAGVVLNVAEDHLDWHGGMAGYVAAKQRALSGEVAVVGIDDPVARSLATDSTVGITLDEPHEGQLGIRDGHLVDRAFGGGNLVSAQQISPPGPAGLTDALAAAALSRAIGVAPEDIAAALSDFTVGAHRCQKIASAAYSGVSVTYIDDSKATNPHAAASSLSAHENVVWIAGGLLKGAQVNDVVRQVASRLRGAVLLGRDAPSIADALSRHAPDVPVVLVAAGEDESERGAMPAVTVSSLPGGSTNGEVMRCAVRKATELGVTAGVADIVVLLAPAAASLDMFASYAERGDWFAAAARELIGSC